MTDIAVIDLGPPLGSLSVGSGATVIDLGEGVSLVEVSAPNGISIFVNDTFSSVTVESVGVPGPVGPPGAGGAAEGFNYAQLTPNIVWNVVHGLGYFPIVQTITLGGMLLEGDVTHYSTDNLAISFIVPVAGRARLI